MDSERATTLREEMVRDQLRGRGIRDERLLTAMGWIPRENFVSADVADRAYRDEALPIDAGQTISQPYMVGWMTELLETQPGMRVLEVGTGSGYQAAVLAAIGCWVISVERHAALAEAARDRLESLSGRDGAGDLRNHVRIEVGDGSMGLPGEAPFERILVTAAAPRVPDALRDQLADGGRLVVPVGPRNLQSLVLVIRQGDDFEERRTGACVFVPLIGEAGFTPEPAADPPANGRFRWFRRRP
jgi:protein-L-isoaspartate(D-aspartate) O-methyltransferase